MKYFIILVLALMLSSCGTTTSVYIGSTNPSDYSKESIKPEILKFDKKLNSFPIKESIASLEEKMSLLNNCNVFIFNDNIHAPLSPVDDLVKLDPVKDKDKKINILSMYALNLRTYILEQKTRFNTAYTKYLNDCSGK